MNGTAPISRIAHDAASKNSTVKMSLTALYDPLVPRNFPFSLVCAKITGLFVTCAKRLFIKRKEIIVPIRNECLDFCPSRSAWFLQSTARVGVVTQIRNTQTSSARSREKIYGFYSQICRRFACDDATNRSTWFAQNALLSKISVRTSIRKCHEDWI